MTSPDPIPTTLSDQLRQLGLVHTASELNDFIARATQKRWSPVVQLERLVHAELEARLRQRVERRLRDARLGRFKPMADWEWEWPKAHPSADRRTRPHARLSRAARERDRRRRRTASARR